MLKETLVPRIPSSFPDGVLRCDPRLPEATLAFRRRQGLTGLSELGAMNVTAWLYQDEKGLESIQLNPNVTIAQLRQQFGPPETPDAEVGIHSEAQAAEWFRIRPALRVLQIFTEAFRVHRCALRCCGTTSLALLGTTTTIAGRGSAAVGEA
jgi:hypothetical protein